MTSLFREFGSELREDILSDKTFPALSAGFTSGLGLLVAQVAFGSFIFSGALAPYSSQGVGLILFGNFAACLLVGLVSSYRGAIAGLSPALVIIMASIAATMDVQGEALFVTTACALILSAIATGVSCLLIGRFHLANLVRFIPYPVAAGFVAGIGGMVCLAAISLMGVNLEWHEVGAFVEPPVLWMWLPGVAYGVALYIAIKRWGNALILPGSVVAAIGAYHLALGALDISGEQARAMGLLLKGTADGGLWPALFPADLAHVEWAAIAAQIPNILTLMLIAFICVTMNVAGLEVAAHQELDWNREFKASGFATVVAGLGGGTVATLIVPSSLRSKYLGATTRLTGVVAAVIIGSALFFGDGMLEYVPTALIGGILVFAGIGMLDEGLVRSYKYLPRVELSIILVIFIVILFIGLIEGVGAGMLATLIFFVVRLSRVNLIEASFTSRERQSSKARPVPDRVILLEEGWRVLAYQLRGYIFFGSAAPLTDHLRDALEGPSPPTCLMLDFDSVSGFDFSAVSVLSRFLQVANKSGVHVVLSAVPDKFASDLERNLPASVYADLVLEPNADRALEHCEETLIARWRKDSTAADNQRASLLEHVADDLERHLERQIQFEELMEELHQWLAPRNYAADELLIGPDMPLQGLQLMISGRASAYNNAGARLYQFSPGDAIWPAGSSSDQVMSVVADEACCSMLLTPDAQHRLEKNEERLALKLYRYLLAGRLPIEADGSLEDPQ